MTYLEYFYNPVLLLLNSRKKNWSIDKIKCNKNTFLFFPVLLIIGRFLFEIKIFIVHKFTILYTYECIIAESYAKEIAYESG